MNSSYKFTNENYATCSKFSCSKSNNIWSIKIFADNSNSVTCAEIDNGKNKTVPGKYTGNILCPDVKRLCDSTSAALPCTNNCNNQGTCY